MNGLKQWDGIKYFRPDSPVDMWGNPHEMKREILLPLDDFREHLGVIIYVTSGYREKSHSLEGGSQHNLGLAVDIVVPAFSGTILDLFIEATRFPFKGIGIYRDWHWAGKKIGGLHLDARNESKGAHWFCYKNPAGIQEYIALNYENLKAYKVL